MNIKKIFIAAASTLSIALSGNSAIAEFEWKVMGKSNGGSEIALAINAIGASEEHGLSNAVFLYRITTQGKTARHVGVVNCLNTSPSYWLTPEGSGAVNADSPASKSMLLKVCQIARSKPLIKTKPKPPKNNVIAAASPVPNGQRAIVLPESTARGVDVIAWECKASATYINEPSENINCDSLKITGLEDKGTYIHYRFSNKFGNTVVFVTERFTSSTPGTAKILAVGKEVDGDLRLRSVEVSPANTCEIKAQKETKVKVSCYYSSDEGTVKGMIDGY
jgi:hypothetical protein